ncbi:cupin domain-containing protein [Photobacterium sp. ZSDE20]|uniref:Cupin domain-containing protein n=1 Tax=Photobacterium pectinilyticum TaxID=2906793 RepID=A0ABT1N1M0_9GAMM|nr:cupin domain-containing protein [Photobacterium sp. ZSDE20]MCQ1058633.1 cupin domain-containing protein [Photobacterium sp. ZSDE20]MDD1824047.1 cupin domain-containing protein [Photobacterium sp. ZSDE20]
MMSNVDLPANDILQVNTEVMNNGETRSRMKSCDGSGYIRTRYPNEEKGRWQNSHFHQTTFETYIVQSGSILYAELIKGELEIRKVTANEVITVKPGVPHNVFVYPNTDLHTVKHGAAQPDDWHACPELDRLIEAHVM